MYNQIDRWMVNVCLWREPELIYVIRYFRCCILCNDANNSLLTPFLWFVHNSSLSTWQKRSTFMYIPYQCFDYFKVTLWCDGEYVPMLIHKTILHRHSSFLVSSLIWNRFGTFCDTHLFKYWLTLHYQHWTFTFYLTLLSTILNTYTLLTEWHWFIFGVSQHV